MKTIKGALFLIILIAIVQISQITSKKILKATHFERVGESIHKANDLTKEGAAQAKNFLDAKLGRKQDEAKVGVAVASKKLDELEKNGELPSGVHPSGKHHEESNSNLAKNPSDQPTIAKAEPVAVIAATPSVVAA
jgi:hypothetical protein